MIIVELVDIILTLHFLVPAAFREIRARSQANYDTP